VDVDGIILLKLVYKRSTRAYRLDLPILAKLQ